MNRILRLSLLFLLPLGIQAQPTVLHNARIYTVDTEHPTAEALAFEDGVLLAVGAETEVVSAYPDAERLDAGGRTVVPGLIDAHAHLMNLGHLKLQADLTGTTSVVDIIARLQAFTADLPDGMWILGRGWDQNDWGGDGAFPTRADLDAAFPDTPVWIERIDGHAMWANSETLRRAGIDPDALAPPNPEGGKVLRDDAGRPTGVFIDRATRIVDASTPPLTVGAMRVGLERALAETAASGLTGLHEAAWTPGDAGMIGFDEGIALYQQMIEEGVFPIRNYLMIMPEKVGPYCAAERVPATDPSGRLVMRSVKVYADGALGSRGAALLADYSDDAGNKGLLFDSEAELRDRMDEAMDCGLQVNTHAIGDRANRVVLDAYERAIEATGGGPGRHRIEHAQIVVTPDDIARFADLDIVASMQPTHATSDMPWAEARVGPDRIQGGYAWRTFINHGVRLALGSDFPVERVSPLLGFYAAITRQDAEGMPEGGWYPDQRLTREEALRGFTLDAAWAGFMEDTVGSLEVGKRADFVVLSRDIMTVSAGEVLATEVVATYLDGTPIWGGLK